VTGRHPRRHRHRRDPLPAADVLRRFRRSSGAPAAGPAGAAAVAWPQVVGAVAADHSAPVRRTRAGVLTVACSSAAWAHELSMRREELTLRLTEVCPEAEVVGLRFSVADHVPVAAGPAPPPPRPPAPAPGPADHAAAEAATAGVEDPEVRALIARAAAASAARHRGAPDT